MEKIIIAPAPTIDINANMIPGLLSFKLIVPIGCLISPLLLLFVREIALVATLEGEEAA